MTTTDPTAVAELSKRVADYVGGVPVTDYLTGCATAAIELVTTYTAGAEIPGPVLTAALTEVAAELYHRKAAPNGVKSYADGLDGATTIRVRRDALAGVKPQLDLYLTPGLA